MKLKLKKGEGLRLSAHLTQAEVDCKCSREDCKETLVDTAAIGLFELVRDVAQAPVTITSWYRCPAHNKEQGGEPESRHLEGSAFDCTPLKGKWSEVQASVMRNKMKGYGGIGLYRRGGTFAWIHFDSSLERNWTKLV